MSQEQEVLNEGPSSIKKRVKLVFNNLFVFIKDSYNRNKWLTIAGLVLAYLILISLMTYIPKFTNTKGTNYFQQTIITIVQATYLIMVCVGLTLTTRVRKFSNFAHAEFLVIGIYVSIYLDRVFPDEVSPWKWIFVEMIIAFVLTGFVAMLFEFLVFGPLTRRNANRLSLMVGSIGVGMIIRQGIQERFGSVPITSSPDYPEFFDKLVEDDFTGISLIDKIIGLPLRDRTIFDLPYGMEIRISRDELWGVITMILMILILRFVFTRTTLGISMRATADDPSLAQITGINTQRVIYWTWFIAGGVTGMGALFMFESSRIEPNSGFGLLLLIFAVVILGGFDSFEGTLISAFLVAAAMNMTVILNSRAGDLEEKSEFFDALIFWSTTGDWKLVVPFGIIIVVLLVRPRGIFGVVDPRSKL
ncbi:MAG: branched-chain amino acid ABC transporter permease [Candidatus Kariarchaeaceae archaeon]|jgi:branched-subunit amino acid ABC-type transport system permease component